MPTVMVAALITLGWPKFACAEAASEEIVTVTADHLPEAVGQAAFSSTTLGKNELAPFEQLDAALEQIPGVSLFRRATSLSANPTTQGISLRTIAPSAASRALVLLDGVPLNDPFGGWVIWSALPPEDIGSAQIIRGAGSGPYGAGALTGTILLEERDGEDGLSQADVSTGSLDTFRIGASGGDKWGPLTVFASGSAEHSNGWIPVEPNSRGPADDRTRFNQGAVSLRGKADLGSGITVTSRLGFYDELRGAGLVGAEATAQGVTASFSLAHRAYADDLGWRIQSWLIDSDLSNISVSTAPRQAGTTPANNQYATPALGWGTNAAILGARGDVRWESGIDMRKDAGESRELYNYSTASGRFLNARRSGGSSVIVGLYGEGAYAPGPWLMTLGVRADYWATSQGHLVQSVAPSGTVTLDNDYPGRNGIVPTGRAGLRRNFDDGEFLRVAAYAGFRAPTLNELYRPFRVGNVVTGANAGLSPEKLDGLEAGWGGEQGAFAWSATGFWNVLHDAIENVALTPSVCASGNGTCQQKRQNVGNIDALGLEAEATETFAEGFSTREALSWTDARVRAEPAAPLLVGKRPAQAPGAVGTIQVHWQPVDKLSFDAGARWVSAQYDDDLNTRKLGSAFTLDMRADWRIRDRLSVFAKIDNALDAKIATGETTGVVNVGEPRIIEVGIGYGE